MTAAPEIRALRHARARRLTGGALLAALLTAIGLVLVTHLWDQCAWTRPRPPGPGRRVTGRGRRRLDSLPRRRHPVAARIPELPVRRPAFPLLTLRAGPVGPRSAPAALRLQRVRLPHAPARLVATALVAVVALVISACSSSSSTAAKRPARAATAATRKCQANRPAPPTVEPVAGTEHDHTMTSFDGSKIRLHWYPITGKAPTILMGPGWGEAGATLEGGTGLFGDSPVEQLHEEGYHVLTWDPRAFGRSTGSITVDAAANEGRDVQALLDWVATQPDVALDATGDPRVGMVGGSYGGGIQLVTAAIDCRVDAIVPTIAWHSLGTSLDKAQTVKSGWANLLYSAAAARQLDPHIRSAYESGQATGTISPEDTAWFLSRGPADAVARITAPTLLIQGTVDTLFTLDEAARNYRILREHRVPTAMLWYCGGHGVCLTNGGDARRTRDATSAWLRRWLQRDASVDTGPRFDLVDQNGVRFTAPDYPVRSRTSLTATGSGTLALTAAGGAGPITSTPKTGSPIDAIAASITPARATNSVDVPVTSTTAAMVVGAPRLTLTYSGTVPPGDRPTRIFAQLVDDTTGIVLGNQVTPIPVTLDGRPHTVTVPLEQVAHSFTAGETVTLQIVATTVTYAPPRLDGQVELRAIRIALPVAAGLTKVG